MDSGKQKTDHQNPESKGLGNDHQRQQNNYRNTRKGLLSSVSKEITLRILFSFESLGTKEKEIQAVPVNASPTQESRGQMVRHLHGKLSG